MNSDIDNLKNWLNTKRDDSWFFYVKRLSGNDTGLTKAHQSGVYIPKNVMKIVFPAMQSTHIQNPDSFLDARVDSHGLAEQALRAIYYNNKFFEGSRNEQRITRWSTGVDYTPLQDSEETGSLTVFAFHQFHENQNTDFLAVWVCKDPSEEAYIEGLTGEIYPGEHFSGKADRIMGGFTLLPEGKTSKLILPEEWFFDFPTGREIIRYVLEAFPYQNLPVDDRLLKRREQEFSVFKAIEESFVLPSIQKGFTSVDDFILFANSVSNRRKSRSGKSLELHLASIFKEAGLHHFGTQCVTEGNNKPDFLFPSCGAYHDTSFPEQKLNMMAVKTTCKDRWRQILNEAHRIHSPYLFTLQEGISENQFREMQRENVRLVVPSRIHRSFPEPIRHELISLNDFIKQMTHL